MDEVTKRRLELGRGKNAACASAEAKKAYEAWSASGHQPGLLRAYQDWCWLANNDEAEGELAPRSERILEFTKLDSKGRRIGLRILTTQVEVCKTLGNQEVVPGPWVRLYTQMTRNRVAFGASQPSVRLKADEAEREIARRIKRYERLYGPQVSQEVKK